MHAQNPAIAKVVSAMAGGDKNPVKDGTLRQVVNPFSYDSRSGNYESSPGPSRTEQAHPDMSAGRNPSMGQSPLMAVSSGAASRTSPGAMEGRDFGAPRVSHTGMERGKGVLTTNPEAVIEMLLAMGIPEPQIQGVLREMGYQYGG